MNFPLCKIVNPSIDPIILISRELDYTVILLNHMTNLTIKLWNNLHLPCPNLIHHLSLYLSGYDTVNLAIRVSTQRCGEALERKNLMWRPAFVGGRARLCLDSMGVVFKLVCYRYGFWGLFFKIQYDF